MSTMTAHAEAERIWHLNFIDRDTEEFARLRDVCEREQRDAQFRRMLGEQYDFLRYHVVALSDQWLPLSALYGAANSGVKHGEYDTLVWLGIAEHKTEDLFSPLSGGRGSGSRSLYRLAQHVEMVKLWCGHEVPAGTGIAEGLCDECSAALLVSESAASLKAGRVTTEAHREMVQHARDRWTNHANHVEPVASCHLCQQRRSAGEA